MAVCAVRPAACESVSARRSRRRAWTCWAVTWAGGDEVRLAHVFLCADICEEFGEAKARREQQGARAIVLTTELRIGTALLEEDGHDLEGILCQGLLCAERPRRKQQDVETGREDVRDKRRIHQRLGRRDVAYQGIPVPTHSHERVDSGLDALRQWQHNTPVVRRLDASTSVDIFSSVPTQVGVSDNVQESMADV